MSNFDRRPFDEDPYWETFMVYGLEGAINEDLHDTMNDFEDK